MITMSPLERMKYNKLPIPSIDEIAKTEQYKSMIKFDINIEREIAGNSAWLFFPETLIVQYFGNKKYEKVDTQKDVDGFMFWHSNRGIITRMIIIPESNYKLLQELDVAKEFIDYFEDKDPIKLISYNMAHRIHGIDSKYRHGNTSIKFFANNDMYIKMEKILPLRR